MKKNNIIDKLYIGIDPGADGGVALINSKGRALKYFRYDDVGLYNLIKQVQAIGEYKFTVEDVHAICGSGAKATFNFGINLGRIYGIAYARQVKINKVTPQIWKKEFDLICGTNYEKVAKKEESIKKAYELFPDIDLKIKSYYLKDENNKFVKDENNKRIKKPCDHDGVAEALLIAEWSRRNDNERE